MKSPTTAVIFKALQIFVVIILFLITVQSLDEIWHGVDTIKFGGINVQCDTVRNGVTVNGICLPILKCPSVLENVRKSLYNHSVCGYEGTTQMVCCPSVTIMTKIQNVVKLNLNKNLECRISNSNATGVMKFLADCPELTENDATLERNRLCDYEICADLVCCPVKLKHRLKKVCQEVDHPEHTLDIRLNFNLKPCTIKELNMTGRYQEKCNFAKRNPHLKSLLKNVCNDKICRHWYCCPIEDGDITYCDLVVFSRKNLVPVGPKCVDSRTGRQGTCKSRVDCYESTGDRTYIDDVTIPLDSCGFYCCQNFICCPDIDVTTMIQTYANKECLSFTHFTREEIPVTLNISDISNTECSAVAAAGGLVVSPGEFPHMAALGYEVDNQILWNCGGSLISDTFVLTAAHCLSNSEYGSVKKVRIGVIDLLNSNDTGDCPEEFDVAQVIPHPEYNGRFVYNDIGLIQLDGKVKFNFHIRPICLPQNSDLPQEYKSMGWGALGPVAKKSVKLIKVNQELFPYDECHKLYSYNSNRRLNRGVLNETQICAGSRTNIQSTCAGDSGGPLLANHPIHRKLFNIYGIVSFGTVCGFANNPGIYTKVFPYVKWIEKIVWT